MKNRMSAGIGVLLLAISFSIIGVSGFAQQAKPPDKAQNSDPTPHSAVHLECAKICSDCQRSCDVCASHCAHQLAGGHKDHLSCLRHCQDCANICAACSRICAAYGPLSSTMAECCAKACDHCAKAWNRLACLFTFPTFFGAGLQMQVIGKGFTRLGAVVAGLCTAFGHRRGKRAISGTDSGAGSADICTILTMPQT